LSIIDVNYTYFILNHLNAVRGKMKRTINTDRIRLKELLRECRLTQTDVARATGLHGSIISRIATGRFRPTAFEKLRIATAVGRKVEEIFPN